MFLLRDTSLQEDTTEKRHRKTNRTKLKQVQSAAGSSENSAAEQVTQHPASGNDDDSITRLSRRAVNAKSALMRIESKVKTKTAPSIGRDPAQDARTVFVGNVALNVNKKVS